MSVQLTFGGQSPGALPVTPQDELVRTWQREMNRLLILASALRGLHERIKKMEGWLAGHDEFDEKFYERSAQYEREKGPYLVQMSRMADLGDQVNGLQRRLSEASIVGLERLWGWPIADHLGMHLAIVARDSGNADFRTVLEAFMLDAVPF